MKKLELCSQFPDHVAFRTGLQGVNGEFWYYETHFKGVSMKFLVPENEAKEMNLSKQVPVSKLVNYLL